MSISDYLCRHQYRQRICLGYRSWLGITAVAARCDRRHRCHASPVDRRGQGRQPAADRSRQSRQIQRQFRHRVSTPYRRIARRLVLGLCLLQRHRVCGRCRRQLKAFALNQALLPASPTSQSQATFPYPGSSPSVSANGTGNAILWTLTSPPQCGRTARLQPGQPRAGVLQQHPGGQRPRRIRQWREIHHAGGRQRRGLHRHAERRGGVRFCSSPCRGPAAVRRRPPAAAAWRGCRVLRRTCDCENNRCGDHRRSRWPASRHRR